MSDFNNDIAIIGMACHYPGAPDIAAFWQNLVDGVESIARFSEEELLAAGVDPDILADPNYVPAYGWLEGIDQFDAGFFGLTPREAQLLDPQQRLFLMCAWHALEDAAVNPDLEKRPVGVFAGAGQPIYYQENILNNRELVSEMGAFQTTLSNDKDFLATRTSYKLNLKGPSLSVQTACSTSLVAIHLAIQSLLNGECDLALAGGSSIVTTGKSGYLYSNEGLFSPDGHCRAFDAQAGGMVGGDGVGAVVLKRLEDAQDEGDTVYAVIKGSAVNNDGANKIGYTAPSVEGQAAAILEAQAVAGIHPETITMIEAHGTGTPLGDPIEVAGLTAAFRTRTSATGYCALGSVKTNIGHTNAAAGVAGVIKTALALYHKTIPPSLNFQTPNPEIDFEQSPFYVITKAKRWTAEKTPRRAGVSSFGLGGTNAHAILEEAPPLATSDPSRPSQLLMLSAKTETALNRQTADLAAYLQSNPAVDLADVAFTLQTGRQRFVYRRTAVAKSVSEAVEALQNPIGIRTTKEETADPPLAFTFPGGGAQYVNMGRDLYESEPFFRSTIDQSAQLLKTELKRDLRDCIYPSSEKLDVAAEELKRPSIGLPALFAVSYATAQLWMSWGIRPQALMGHSLGEYAAACLAGVFSLEEALRLVIKRGQLFEQMPRGAMLSVGLPEATILSYFQQIKTRHPLSIAAINAPEQSVIAGTVADLALFEQLLESKEVPSRQLAIDVAAHSVLVESILDEFRDFVAKIQLSTPNIPFISNVSGDWITAEEATNPNYWAKHLRQTVRFADGITKLLEDSGRVILEVGPGQVLTTLARLNPGAQDRTFLNSLRHPKQQLSDAAFIIGILGQLWHAGSTIDWNAFYAGQRRHHLSLPNYPFDKQRYWLDPVPRQTINIQSKVPKKNPDLREWLYTPSWQRTPPLSQDKLPDNSANWLIFIDDNGLGRQIIEQLRTAEQQVISVTPGETFRIDDGERFVINPEQPRDFQTLIETLNNDGRIPTHIIHLWQVGPVVNFGQTDLERELNLGFFSLLYLAQALDFNAITSPITLTIVTNGMQEVTGLEQLAPERAAVLGPCKVIPFEYDHINCRCIDVEFPTSIGTAERILAESLLPPTDQTETIIAYRGRFRWQQTFTRVPHSSPEKGPLRLRENGVYLITGGLGGIGLALAVYLVREVQARLVLIGRSGLPGRNSWESVTDPLLREQIATLEKMETMGAEVMVAKADVANKGQMAAAFQQIKERFGSLNGIIHSAGIGGDGAITLKDKTQAMAVLAAKIWGTQILHNLCQDELDFMILNSSGAAILGGYGQVDYCAANAVLDAYAPYRARHNGFTTAINWDMWQSVGMGIKTRQSLPPDQRKLRDDALKLGMKIDEGQRVFQNILNQDLSQVVVSTYDFNKRRRELNNQSDAMVDPDNQDLKIATTQLEAASPASARPSLETSYLAPQNKVEEMVAGRWQMLFGIDQIGINDDFFALGGHSLLATQLLNRLRKDFPTALISLHDLFANPTIAGISTLIQEQTERPTQENKIHTNDFLKQNPESEQLTLMTAYLQEHLSEILGIDNLNSDTNLLDLGLEANTADIIWRLRRDMALRVYPQEIISHSTLASMADYLAKALIQQQSWTKSTEETAANDNGRFLNILPTIQSPTFKEPAAKNPPMIFLLSAPRSGSTLLRLMLAGHPSLFCPPELSLLAYENLGDWQAHQQAFFSQTGLHEALSTLLGLEAPAIAERIEALSKLAHPIQATYKLLQDSAAPQILVDKTPGYAQHPTVLARAEAMFEQPKYIHLVRHPYPVIESFVRHRLHIVLGQPEVNPAVLGEAVWTKSQQNLLDFGQTIPSNRYLQLLYEELVQQPRTTLENICRFLDIPFNEAVLQPYAGERMIAGPGDPDILQHDAIDPELAHIWQKIRLPHPLKAETEVLAAVFGYELPNERHTKAEKNSEAKHPPDNLEDLSDAEVDALLRQLMEE